MRPPEPGPVPPHLDASDLGDLAAGLLAEPDAAAARGHLADCPDCDALAGRLDALAARLASLPEPEPMPPDVVARLDAALLAVSMADAKPAAVSMADAEPAAVVPIRAGSRAAAPATARGRSAARGWLQLAAAAAAVLVFGALAGPVLRGLGGTSSQSSAGSPASGEDSAGGSSSSADGPARAAAAAASTVVLASGRAYEVGNVGAQTHALLASAPLQVAALPAPGTPASAPSPSGSPAPQAYPMPQSVRVLPSAAQVDGALGKLRDPAAVQTCATRLAGRPPLTPVSVDLATYAGRPAAVLVLPVPGDPAHLDVSVVAPGCPTGGRLAYIRIER